MPPTKGSCKGKIVLKCCNIYISKTPGRGSIQPSPPHLYHDGGMNLHVCPRVNYRGFVNTEPTVLNGPIAL